ncbi:hypothetical protein N665_0603s0009 [Sinapis alba]|nr:hypothetical protein N665_0603s0009 [Sinapis alba]
MASSYFVWPQEEEDTFEDHIEDEPYVEPPFDESILTPEQSIKVDELYEENPMLTRSDMEAMLRLNLMSHRTILEGRELTCLEIRIAHELKKVIYWVPPTQQEGIYASTFELHDIEDICLPCIEDITSSLDFLVEKLARDHLEICFNKNCLYASIGLESDFLMLDEPRPLLEPAELGNELDVDKLLLDIENPLVKNNHENKNIVFYLIDGDIVDYFVKTLFEPVVDFVFPPNAFNSHDHLNLKEHFIIYATSLVKLFDEKCVYFLWTVVCSFAHFVSCSCRRRTKGALAQPFDSYD